MPSYKARLEHAEYVGSRFTGWHSQYAFSAKDDAEAKQKARERRRNLQDGQTQVTLVDLVNTEKGKNLLTVLSVRRPGF